MLIIVEGTTDIKALAGGLSNLVDQSILDVQFTHIDKNLDAITRHASKHGRGCDDRRTLSNGGGDIFGEMEVTPSNIKARIQDWCIKPWLEDAANKSYYPKAICRIYQIADMDGTYVPDECVRYGGSNLRDNRYTDTGILACNTQKQHEFMARRRANIDTALEIKTVKVGNRKKEVPYKLFYFSSNMDHFTDFGSQNANMTKSEKVTNAYKFSSKYSNDPEAYREFFDSCGNATQDAWEESWRTVREGMNSIRRGTNYGLLIDEIVELYRQMTH